MKFLASFPRPLIVAAAIVAAHSSATAADTAFAAPASAQTPAASDLSIARERIAAKDWAGAEAELVRLNAKQSADWNNLMGYTLRKKKQPNLEAAGKYYAQALRIDPQHRGALSYSGELALQLNDEATAMQRLETLEKVCGTSDCPELQTLRESLKQHKLQAK